MEDDHTVMIESVPFRTETIHDADTDEMPFPYALQDETPVARLERKLDAALRMISTMQARIESLDATLLRVLMR